MAIIIALLLSLGFISDSSQATPELIEANSHLILIQDQDAM